MTCMKCSMCGGVAHPATGCQYSQNFIVCGPCTREAWQWLRQFTASKGRRSGPSFYDHVNKISDPITVSGPEGPEVALSRAEKRVKDALAGYSDRSRAATVVSARRTK